MADKTFYIDDTTKRRTTVLGIHDTSAVNLLYKVEETWTYNVRDSDLASVDYSDIASMRAALDDDRDDFSDPLIRILNADIDYTQASSGIFAVTVNSGYDAFRLSVNSVPFRQTYMQLLGFDSSGVAILNIIVPVFAYPGIDMSGGLPNLPEEYYNMTESDARFTHILAAGVEDNIMTFDNAGDIQDSGTNISYITGDVVDHIADLTNPHVVTQTQVGLSNVDNTSDANKPVSTAQQAALDLKLSIADIVNDLVSTDTDKALSANQGKELKTLIDALSSDLTPQGAWNASTNTPALPGTADTGDFWIVSAAGSINLDGITDWEINDWAVKTATGWAKVDNTEQDHKDTHDPQDGSDALDTASAAEISVVVGAGTGTSHSFSRADHIHAIQHSILDNHLATYDGTQNSGEICRMTASGIESRTDAEMKTQLGYVSLTGAENIAGVKTFTDNLIAEDDVTISDSLKISDTVITGFTHASGNANDIYIEGQTAAAGNFKGSNLNIRAGDGTGTGAGGYISFIPGVTASGTDGYVVFCDSSGGSQLYVDTSGLSLLAGASVDNIETTITDDDTHLPTSGAVFDGLALKAPIANPTFTGEIGIGTVNVSETELGILEGATLDTAELNYVDGVTSAIQTQLGAKVPDSGNTNIGGVKTFTDTTDSTSKDTGGAIFEGGVGIEKSVLIGDYLKVGDDLTGSLAVPAYIDLGDSIGNAGPTSAQCKLLLYHSGTTIAGLSIDAGGQSCYFALNNATSDHVFFRGSIELIRFEGDGRITVPAATNYETLVDADDVIPNKKYVDDSITSAGGFPDPMTTRGDVIIRDAANATSRLAIGANAKVLTSDGTDISWQAQAGGGDVLKVGTPADSQVGVWTGDGTIEGAASFTYDGANLQLTGDIGSTGTKITKGWFTDLEVANAIAGDITGTAGIATLVTITDNESTNENNPMVFVAGADPDGGNLGLESDGTCTYNPSTGKITATGFVGTLTGAADTVATITGLAPDTATSQATQASITSAANLATVGTITSGALSTGAVLADVTMTLGSDADGDVYYRASSKLTRLAKGTADQVLAMNAGATAPEWTDPSAMTGVYRNIWIDAAAMVARTTNGAEATTVEHGTNDIEIDSYAFDASTEEGVQFKLAMPDEWDRGNVKVKFYWDAKATASGTAVWGIKAGALSNSDAIDAALGSEVTVTDTLLTVGDCHVSPASGALTVGGTPALEDMIIFQVVCKTSGTIATDTLLMGISIQYNESTTEPSIW